MTFIDDLVWTMMDIFDDIYFDLKAILIAIEMDELAGMLEPSPPPPQEFDPLKTIGKYC